MLPVTEGIRNLSTGNNIYYINISEVCIYYILKYELGLAG